MAFDAAARTITGTPTAAAATATYTYTVTDSDAADPDSDTIEFEITVLADLEPTLGTATVDDQTYGVGVLITPLELPEATGGNPPLTYTLTPALPAGLAFDAATRTISGTPTAVAAAATYTYKVTDSDAADPDSDTIEFEITVLADLEPTLGTATVDDQTYGVGVLITPLELPEATGGNPPLTYALTPALPAGLAFDAATRTISGTPAAVAAVATYTYKVTDSDAADPDSDTIKFEITVIDLEPTFGMAAVDDQTYQVGTLITPLELPEATGGNPPLTYTLTPALPCRPRVRRSRTDDHRHAICRSGRGNLHLHGDGLGRRGSRLRHDRVRDHC